MSVQFGKLISRIQQAGSPSEREGRLWDVLWAWIRSSSVQKTE